MAGTQNQPNPQEPYGQQQQQQPVAEFAPPVTRKAGSMASKIWGIVLLVLGGIGAIMVAMSFAMVSGGGLKASTFGFNMSPEAKNEMDRVVQVIAEDAMQRWTFWANISAEILIIVLSIAAGLLLAVRPRAAGRKLAIARALIVFLAIPLYGYENMATVRQQNEMTASIQEIQIEDIVKQEKARNPGQSEEETERRRKEIKDALASFQPAMQALGYVGTVVTVIGVIAINGLLLFFMTRPSVKSYLATAATEGDVEIPNYDPSMGLMGGAPPPSAAPPQQQPPGGQPPPV